MSQVILTDTCFWLGLLDSRDQHHKASKVIAELLEEQVQPYKILFPWPCLYETISTRLTRQRESILQLETLLAKPQIEVLDDMVYRDNAIKQLFELNRLQGRSPSLVDAVVNVR